MREIAVYVNEDRCNGLSPCQFLRGNNSKGTCHFFGELKADEQKILPHDDCIGAAIKEVND